MVSIQSLRVDYDNVAAVQDISFEVPAGAIYGLVGPNGAGKTSTLKAIAGLIEPTYGTITVDGYDLETHLRQALGRMGFMPDFPPVYEYLTVYEYLDVFAAAYHISPGRRKALIDEWLYRVSLTDKAAAYVHTLSRGMRQRLVCAKTLLHNPAVVILDEPASGLDPISRMELRALLKNTASAGTTIIISSHILTELSDFCTAIGIMEKGRMVVSGDINHIRAALNARGELHISLAGAPGDRQVVYLLNQIPHISELREHSETEFSAIFSGTQNDAADILERLITQNIKVAQFYIKEANVEDIFFKIGARETS